MCRMNPKALIKNCAHCCVPIPSVVDFVHENASGQSIKPKTVKRTGMQNLLHYDVLDGESGCAGKLRFGWSTV